MMRAVRKEAGRRPRLGSAAVEETEPAFGIVIWPGAGDQGEGGGTGVPRQRVRLRNAFAPRWPV